MNNPVLSICAGTINRARGLQAMVRSARETLPRGLTYEFIIADNGSEDGTPEWVGSQPDMTLIQHGKPVGGVTAMTSAAQKARGKYVLIATDDIVFHPSGIISAIRALEDNPRVGAITFANDHNKSAPAQNGQAIRQSASHGLAIHRVLNADGEPALHPYPQIALVRRELGDACGWWTGDGKLDGLWTYAGDNALGQEIWARGYTCEGTKYAKNDERQVQDGSRVENTARHKADAEMYYGVYGKGLRFGSIRFDWEPQNDLRVLWLDAYSKDHPLHFQTKRGMREALQRVAIVAEFDYQHDARAQAQEFYRIMDAFEPHLLLSNIHNVQKFPADVLVRGRKLSPNTVCVNWIGDYWPELYLNPNNRPLHRAFDLVTTVNAAMIEPLESFGARAAFWGGAWEPVGDDALPKARTHDVVFLGNNYSPKRQALAQAVREAGGALYGTWPDAVGQTMYDFPKMRAIYNNAKIAISDNQFPDSLGYTSNRFYHAIVSKALVLHQESPGFEEYLGFVDGKHYVAWSDLNDLLDKIAYYTDPAHEDERKEIAKAGRLYARRWHSYDARVKQLLTKILPEKLGEKVYA